MISTFDNIHWIQGLKVQGLTNCNILRNKEKKKIRITSTTYHYYDYIVENPE